VLADMGPASCDGHVGADVAVFFNRVGIADALRKGMQLLGDLDVIVAIAAREDDVMAATWRIARQVEGQGTPATDAPALPSAGANDVSPAAVAASANPASPPGVTPLGRAS